MSKHTPGPWSVGEVSHKKQRVDIDSLHADQTVGHQTWRGLARAYGCEDMPAEGTAAMLANARLIAAAPTMYEYIILSASKGCATAKKIMEAINASS